MKDQVQEMIMHSSLLSGGIEPRLISTTFTKPILDIIEDLKKILGDKPS